MKQLSVFIATLVLTAFAFLPATARADGLDDLDVTMEVFDGVEGVAGKIAEMDGPDDDNVEGDGMDGGSDHEESDGDVSEDGDVGEDGYVGEDGDLGDGDSDNGDDGASDFEEPVDDFDGDSALEEESDLDSEDNFEDDEGESVDDGEFDEEGPAEEDGMDDMGDNSGEGSEDDGV